MKGIEKILEEVNRLIEKHKNNAYELIAKEPLTQCYTETDIEQTKVHELAVVRNIIRKHMNDGWISVEEPPKKDYTAVFAVDKHDYYFVAVYDKEHGYRTNDVGADVDNIVAYCLFNPYRPERSEE